MSLPTTGSAGRPPVAAVNLWLCAHKFLLRPLPLLVLLLVCLNTGTAQAQDSQLGDLLDQIPLEDVPMDDFPLSDGGSGNDGGSDGSGSGLPFNTSDVPGLDCASRSQDLSAVAASADNACAQYPCSTECLDSLRTLQDTCADCYAGQCPESVRSLNVTDVAEQCEAATNQLCAAMEGSFYNCSDGREMTASWCQYQNPFVVPRPLPWPETDSGSGGGGSDADGGSSAALSDYFTQLAAQYVPEYQCTDGTGASSDAWDAPCRMVDAFSAVEVIGADAPFSGNADQDRDGVTHFVTAASTAANASLTLIINPVTNTEIWSDRAETADADSETTQSASSAAAVHVALQAALADLAQPTSYFIAQACTLVSGGEGGGDGDGASLLRVRYVANSSLSKQARRRANATTAPTSVPLMTAAARSTASPLPASAGARGGRSEKHDGDGDSAAAGAGAAAEDSSFEFTVNSVDVRLDNMSLYRGLNHDDQLLSFVVRGVSYVGVPVSYRHGSAGIGAGARTTTTDDGAGDASPSRLALDGVVLLQLHNASVAGTAVLWDLSALGAGRVLSLEATRHHWGCGYADGDAAKAFFQPDNLRQNTALDRTCAYAHTVVTVTTPAAVHGFHFDPDDYDFGARSSWSLVVRTVDSGSGAQALAASLAVGFSRAAAAGPRGIRGSSADPAEPLQRYSAAVRDVDDTAPQPTTTRWWPSANVSALTQPWSLFNVSQLADLDLGATSSPANSGVACGTGLDGGAFQVTADFYEIAAASLVTNQWPKVQSPLALTSYLQRPLPTAQEAWLLVVLNPRAQWTDCDGGGDDAHDDGGGDGGGGGGGPLLQAATRVLTLSMTALNSMQNRSQPTALNPCGLAQFAAAPAWSPGQASPSSALPSPSPSEGEPPLAQECASDCQYGLDCDQLGEALGDTCEGLEDELDCDCSGCACTPLPVATTAVATATTATHSAAAAPPGERAGGSNTSSPSFAALLASASLLVGETVFEDPSVRIQSMTTAWRSVATQVAAMLDAQNLTSATTSSGLPEQLEDGSSLADHLQDTGLGADDASTAASDLAACLQSDKPSNCATNSVSGFQNTIEDPALDPTNVLALLGGTDLGGSTSKLNDFSADDADRLYGLNYVVHMADQDRSVHIFHAYSLPPGCTGATVDVRVPAAEDNTVPHASLTNGTNSSKAGEVGAENALTAPALTLERVNKLSVLGNVGSMSASPNGQHLFIKTTRERWELLSMERVMAVCAQLARDVSDPFLEAFIPACFEPADAASTPRFPRPDDFVMATSACITGTLCTSFNTENVTEIAAGYFSDFHFDVGACSSGHFCSSGIEIPCPRGYVCPNTGLAVPVRCAYDPTHATTCFDVGLTAPAACPDGFICSAPHLAPTPVPPGAAAAADLVAVAGGNNSSSNSNSNSNSTSNYTDALDNTSGNLAGSQGRAAPRQAFEELQENVLLLYQAASAQDSSPGPGATATMVEMRASVSCTEGMWCPLGRAFASVATGQPAPAVWPAAAGDSSTEAMHALGCPPGYACSEPGVVVPTACNRTTRDDAAISCASGSSSVVTLCPVGFFCRSQDGAAFVCANGSFCPAGSASAQLCAPGAYCPNVTVQLSCPSGHYCPEASMDPVACGWLDFCPEGVASPVRLSVLLALAGVALVLLLIVRLVPLVSSTPRGGESSKRAVVMALSSAKGTVGGSGGGSASVHVARMPRTRRPRTGRDKAVVSATAAGEEHQQGNVEREWDAAKAEAPVPPPGDGARLSTAVGAAAPDLPSLHARHGSGNSSVVRVARDPAADVPLLHISFKNLGLRLASAAPAKKTKKKKSNHQKKATTVDAVRTASASASPGDAPAPKPRVESGVILQGVTGTLHGGRTTAVMGPSGAGKTTFITTLTSKAYYGVRTGRVQVNGLDDDLARYRTLTGFVPQDDIMLSELTAGENLFYSGRARLPRTRTDAEVCAVVADTLALLGLTADRDQVVDTLSSGKRKAVNIGMELVAQPRLLFVDEPTTGLDSTSSLAICTTLRRISRRGLTVVAVVHQPRFDAFRKFDDVLLLGKGGRTVYLGPTAGVLGYFARVGYKCPPRANPADFLLDVVAGQYVREAVPITPKTSVAAAARGGEGRASGGDAPARPGGRGELLDLFQLWVEHGTSSAGDDAGGQKSAGGGGGRDSAAAPTLAVDRVQLGLLRLFWLYLMRALRQHRRALGAVVADLVVVLFAAVFLGLLYFDKSQGRGSTHLADGGASSSSSSPSSSSDACEHCGWLSLGDPAESFHGCPPALVDELPPVSLALGDQILSRGSMCCIAIGLTSVTAFMKVFSSERAVYFRENAGQATYKQSFAYFAAKDVAALPQCVVAPLLFSVVLHALTSPLATVQTLYLPMFAVYYATAGISFIVSIVAPESLNQLIGVVAVFALTCFAGGMPPLASLDHKVIPLRYFYHASYLRYALEAFYVGEAAQWASRVERTGIDFAAFLETMYGYHLDSYAQNVGICFAWGLGFRLCALVIMMFKDRAKKL